MSSDNALQVTFKLLPNGDIYTEQILFSIHGREDGFLDERALVT
jgi:hypothetical protein